MSKSGGRLKPSSLLSDGLVFLSGAFVSLLLVLSLYSFSNPHDPFPSFSFPSSSTPNSGPNFLHDPPDTTFYDDPTLHYSFSSTPIRDWDEHRRRWLRLHPSFSSGAGDRVLMITGSQPKPCKNPMGDHLLLRLFKNKVDYARIHGYDIFYNNVLLDRKMFTYWAKYPVVRAAMIAHPEAEWIWWVDSDAAITDMDFKLPLHRYKDHNLVVHGWTNLVYTDRRSWVGINAGVFLIRNCQWSMDLLEKWIAMGPSNPNYPNWGKIQKSVFPDKLYPEADDQTGLLYLMVKEKDKIGDKVYIESAFYFEGYWVEIVGKLRNTTAMYTEMERREKGLRRRRAEKVSEAYALKREALLELEGIGYGKESWRRPFITHFTGCQPCSGKHNQMYTDNSCWDGMEMALNFADNQVLRSFGFVHPDLLISSRVEPLPFGFPGGDGDGD